MLMKALKPHRQNRVAIFALTARVPTMCKAIYASPDRTKYTSVLDRFHADNEMMLEEKSIPRVRGLPMSSMPGPGGLARLPYIGTLFLFHPFTKYTIETYSQLGNALHQKHGPVFKLRHGKNYAVHTCNVEDIERIFCHEPKYPRKRLMDLARVYRERSGLPQALNTCNGPEWHSLRRSLNAPLKKPKAMLGYLSSQNDVADDFVERLLATSENQAPQNAEDLNDLFFRYSCENVGVVCFGERTGFLSHDLKNCPEKKQLLEAFRTYFDCTFQAAIGLERRYLRTEKDEFYQLYKDTVKYIRNYSSACVKKAMSRIQNESTKHKDHDDECTDNSHLLKTLVLRGDLSFEQIMSVIDSLLIAGTESTAKILSVLLYDMAINPDIQESVALEVRSVIGPEEPLNTCALEKLQLVKACVKESMRVNFPLPSGVERTLSHDMILSGYHVTAGTSIIMNGNRVARDPTYFPDPKVFRPERWMRQYRHPIPTPVSTSKDLEARYSQNMENCDHQAIGNEQDVCPQAQSRLSAFAFLPFGHGARSCVGSRIAELELIVGLAKVVQKLRVSIHPSFKDLNVKYTPFITPTEPIPLVFNKR